MEKKIKGHPPRLSEVFQRYDSPLYFVTFCTRDRRRILAQEFVHTAFCDYARRGWVENGVTIGRCVIMPDHIHLFVRGDPDFILSSWMHGLKRALSQTLKDHGQNGPIWQPGFFDHLLRSSDSYSEKWEYVCQNPVRAGLVKEYDDWPYQGEIAAIDRV